MRSATHAHWRQTLIVSHRSPSRITHKPTPHAASISKTTNATQQQERPEPSITKRHQGSADMGDPLTGAIIDAAAEELAAHSQAASDRLEAAAAQLAIQGRISADALSAVTSQADQAQQRLCIESAAATKEISAARQQLQAARAALAAERAATAKQLEAAAQRVELAAERAEAAARLAQGPVNTPEEVRRHDKSAGPAIQEPTPPTERYVGSLDEKRYTHGAASPRPNHALYVSAAGTLLAGAGLPTFTLPVHSDVSDSENGRATAELARRSTVSNRSNITICDRSDLDVVNCSNADIVRCSNVDISNCSNLEIKHSLHAVFTNCSNVDLYDCTRVKFTDCSNVDLYNCHDIETSDCSNVDSHGGSNVGASSTAADSNVFISPVAPWGSNISVARNVAASKSATATQMTIGGQNGVYVGPNGVSIGGPSGVRVSPSGITVGGQNGVVLGLSGIHIGGSSGINIGPRGISIGGANGLRIGRSGIIVGQRRETHTEGEVQQHEPVGKSLRHDHTIGEMVEHNEGFDRKVQHHDDADKQMHQGEPGLPPPYV
ncbi:hypothetical protein BAUCODRAFT_39515 [Baudoinia panamericana UAMH 10762]|uniref:Uncharacterized protein n=1 Tax=Baudoinia panamericana (strain UAMH 10762) TaxID=717646 RepID=M2M436_BAUPA|nr:uncharacterized protein BAUCODRAFT_39515 [Baudoinia panamericana UAMH 10762]EMC91346.1 hypothetical protein BAUCODRAFT_39515 [Baudoinia panamericana UAMH 10762]